MPGRRRADKADRQRRAGEWLRRQREARGLTPTRLAALLEVHPAQVSNYELGKNAVPDDRAEDLARVLDMDVMTVRRGLGLWVPEDDGSADKIRRDEVVEQALDEMRQSLVDSRLFGKRQIEDLVSYARFLASGQATERDSHRD